MTFLKRLVLGIIYYSIGNVFAVFLYDRKYLKGRWFEGKFDGLCSRGWKWIVNDTVGSLFLGNICQAPWPVDPRTSVVHWSNISFHIEDLHIFQNPGCYFQAHGEIVIGKGAWIAPNVGLITSNHNFRDLNFHNKPQPIILGENCWIGMNSMILPGVKLGKNTIVGAGSVVTKSFEDGNCIIAGNPARIIKFL